MEGKRRRHDRRRQCLIALSMLLWSGCIRSGDTIRIDLFVTAKTPLKDVWVLVGKEKYLWPQLAPDERGTFQVHLRSEELVVIRYRLPNGQKAEWTGKVSPITIRVVQADLTGSSASPADVKLVKR